MTHNRFLQPAVAGIVTLVLVCTLALHASAAPKANPFAAGECTNGVWQVWVGWLGHPGVPSLRSAKYWWPDALAAGWPHSAQCTQPFAIMVIDGTKGNPKRTCTSPERNGAGPARRICDRVTESGERIR